MKVMRFGGGGKGGGKKKKKDRKIQPYLWSGLPVACYCLEAAAAKAELSVRARVLICTC